MEPATTPLPELHGLDGDPVTAPRRGARDLAVTKADRDLGQALPYRDGQFDMVRSIGAAMFGLELLLVGTALWKATSADDAISHSQEQGTLAS